LIDIPGADRPPVMAGPVPAIPTSSVAARDYIFRNSARASRPDLKVLFVTGYAENASFRGDFLDPGMDMLTKPFALDALGAKVRSMIER